MSKPCSKRNASNKFTWVTEMNKSKNEQNKSDKEQITNLIADLAVAMNDKMKIESENAVLKIEIQDYKNEINNLENKLLDIKSMYMENIDHLQGTLQQTAFNSNEAEKEHLAKMNILQESYRKERDLAVTRESELRKQVEILKLDLSKAKQDTIDTVEKLKTCKDKSATYKEKLKFSINLISKLNSFLNKANKSQVAIDKHCQTEEKLSRNPKENCTCPTCSLVCENMVISELFFKENPFTDTLQDIFFNETH